MQQIEGASSGETPRVGGFEQAAEVLSAAKETPVALDDIGVEALGGELVENALVEHHRDWPSLSMYFYLSPHGSMDDVPNLRERLEGADVYLFESPNPVNAAEFFQSVADADPVQPSLMEQIIDSARAQDSSTGGPRPIKGSFMEAQVRALYGSKIAIGHIDTNSERSEEEAEISTGLDEALNRPIKRDGTFGEALDSVSLKYADVAAWTHRRELEMVNQLEPELERLFAERPELLQLTDLKVVGTMGAYHTPLVHKFRQKGIETDRGFSGNGAYSYDYRIELLRTFAFDKKPSGELLSRAYGEQIVSEVLERMMEDDKYHRDNSEWAMYMRSIISEFNVSEIENIHDQRREGELPDIDLIRMIWEAKKLGPLPRNANELREYMEKSVRGAG